MLLLPYALHIHITKSEYGAHLSYLHTQLILGEPFFLLLGSLEMCLNKLPFPAQTKDDCTITMLNSRDHFIDLFKAKVCKGWWVMTGKDKKTGYVCEKV